MNKYGTIYARFSFHSQNEQSIEGQLRVCREFAKNNGIVIVHEYIDRALSGTSDKRPEFLRMIEDARHKKFEIVLVYQLDRFARNRYDSAIYKNRLQKCGVKVLSAKENITDDASGILVEGLLESMAEYYSKELAVKVKRGIKESRIKGNFTGGYVSYGYNIVNKKWVVNETEAAFVRKMFADYQSGKQLKTIAKELNESGIRNNLNLVFRVNMILRILHSKKYIGIIEGDITYTDIVPPIVDKELFEAVNKRLEVHKHKAAHARPDIPYYLSGKLNCGYCWTGMTAETGTSKTGKIHSYYKCFKRKLDGSACGKENITRDKLEGIIVEKTIKHVLLPDIIDDISKRVADAFNSAIEDDTVLVSLEQQLKQTKNAITNIMKAVENGFYNAASQERMLALEVEKTRLEDEIAVQSAKSIKPMSADEVKAFIKLFAEADYSDDWNKHRLLEMFVHKVILYDDKVIIIYNTTDNIPKSDNLDLDAYLKEKAELEYPLGFKFGKLGGARETLIELLKKTKSRRSSSGFLSPV